MPVNAIGIPLRLSNRHGTMRSTKAGVFVVTQMTFSDESIVKFDNFFGSYIENVCNISK